MNKLLELKTTIEPFEFSFKQDFDTQIVLIGSCFSENIGSELEKRYCNTLINPFGIVFNVVSLRKQIESIVKKSLLFDLEYYTHSELFFLHDLHSKVNATSEDELLNKVENIINNSHIFFKKSNTIILTLGTSTVYQLKHNDVIVANCHKRNAKDFIKRTISFSETIAELKTIIGLLKTLNPNINIIFTVSPVRHIKDKLIENQYSKSILRAAIGELVAKDSQLHYFPAYEIIMDDLRDYRFFTKDLIHPNDIAINYIWEIFKTAFFSSKSNTVINEIDRLHQILAHKPINEYSLQHITINKKTLDALNDIKIKFNKT